MLLEVEQSTLVVLWVIAGAIAVGVSLPMLLGLLGLSRFRCRLTEDPAEAPPPPGDAECQAVVSRLTELGFRPLGTRLEQAWFFAFHWVKSFHLRMFGTPDGECFASVYRLIDGEPWRVCLSTGLEGGGLVMTGSTMEQLEIREETFFRWGFATDDLGELLAHHREVVRRFGDETGRAVEKHTLASLDDLIAVHSDRQVRKDGPATALSCLFVALVNIAAPPFFVGEAFGTDGPVMPLAVAAGAVSFPFVMRGLVRQSARQSRAEDAARTAG